MNKQDEPKPGLRWLKTTRTLERYDDRTREWYQSSYEGDPVLQYHDGNEWKDVPTEKVTVAGYRPQATRELNHENNPN